MTLNLHGTCLRSLSTPELEAVSGGDLSIINLGSIQKPPPPQPWYSFFNLGWYSGTVNPNIPVSYPIGH